MRVGQGTVAPRLTDFYAASDNIESDAGRSQELTSFASATSPTVPSAVPTRLPASTPARVCDPASGGPRALQGALEATCHVTSRASLQVGDAAANYGQIIFTQMAFRRPQISSLYT